MSDMTEEELSAKVDEMLGRAEPADLSKLNPSEFLRDLSWLGQDGADVHQIVIDLYTKYRDELAFLMVGRLADILVQNFTPESITDWINHLPDGEGGPEAATILTILTIPHTDKIAVARFAKAFIATMDGHTEGDMLHGMAHLLSESPVAEHVRMTDEELADYDKRYDEFLADHPELKPVTTTDTTEKSA